MNFEGIIPVIVKRAAQLRSKKDIETGKSKAYVITTQEELDDWIVIQDNFAKPVIGDNICIADREVMGYW
ncbi:MAG: hypothetical protein EZS28_036653 [Streblomastix strix]|uniref:Uncharacterized protein n=1 Tax=Streblomastix strix TaxID=222440 RepID=A0A5J4UC98_9EUKA|nr:MAG: hypothetical protein EZS28_036653 [Streblomastix strix]